MNPNKSLFILCLLLIFYACKNPSPQAISEAQADSLYRRAVKEIRSDLAYPDYKEANKNFSLAAEAGHLEALVYFGKSQLYGANKNVAKGIEYLEKASQRGHTTAMRYLADYYAKQEQPEAMLIQLLKAHERGDLEVSYELAYFYIYGSLPHYTKYVAPKKYHNIPKGLAILEAIAKENQPDALYELAFIHFKGISNHVILDIQKAKSLLQKCLSDEHEDYLGFYDQVNELLEEINELPTIPPQTFKDFFFLLPEGVGEVLDIVANGDVQKSYELLIQKNGIYFLEVIEAEQSISLCLFEHQSSPEKSLLGVGNRSRQLYDFQLFKFEQGKAVLQKVNQDSLLPKLSIDWEATPYLYIKEKNRITTLYQPRTTHQQINVKLKYDIGLLWDGEKFTIEKRLAK